MVYLCVYFLVLEHAWERCWQAGVCPQAAWTPGSIFPLPSAQGEVRDKQTTFYRNRNLHTCLLVSCGSQNSIKASHPSIRPSVHPSIHTLHPGWGRGGSSLGGEAQTPCFISQQASISLCFCSFLTAISCLSAGVNPFSTLSFPVDSFYTPSCAGGLHFPVQLLRDH